MSTVAVVGGGITGLTVAFRLSQCSIPVTLYEAGERVGGPLQTLQERGYLSEYGPNTILETSPKITSLIKDLGVDHRRRQANPAMNKNYIVRGGEMRELPLSPIRFLASPLFSLPAKLRVCCELFIRRMPTTEDESLADFVRRRLGEEFLDYAINPFVAGVYAGDPENLSVRSGFPKLKGLENKYGSIVKGAFLGAGQRKKGKEVEKSRAIKLSFDEGLQVLPEALHARLDKSVRLRAKVTGLRQAADGWSVFLNVRGQEEQHQHSAVILTAPAHQAAEINLETPEPVSLALLKQIVHPPVACVTMGFRREDVLNPLDGFGFLVPKKENLKILGTTFSSSLFANRAPADHVLLTTFLGGCRQPELATEPADKLYDFTLRDLRQLLGVVGEPTYQHHHLYTKAIPQYNVGHQTFLDFMKATESALPGLYFAGSYRDGISASNCIVAGHETADRVVQFLTKLPFRPKAEEAISTGLTGFT